MIKKICGKDYQNKEGALTLDTLDVQDVRLSDGRYVKVNKSGWTIIGEIHEDYFEWVNEFEAYHKKYGVVYGDFEIEVFATSEEAYNHFYKHHKPKVWDYGDI